MTVVRTAYRYKRPPRRKKAVALEVPAVVKAASQRQRPKPAPAAPPPPANDDRAPPPPPAASAIVTIRSRKGAMLAHLLEDLTPEELRRRGDVADAMMREIKRRIAKKIRP
jgi:hypothetical protein